MPPSQCGEATEDRRLFASTITSRPGRNAFDLPTERTAAASRSPDGPKSEGTAMRLDVQYGVT